MIAEYLKSGKSITIKTQWLIVIEIIGIGIAEVAKIVGGFFTAFNDIFAAFGYGAISLFIYTMGCSAINKFIFFTSILSSGAGGTSTLPQDIYFKKSGNVSVLKSSSGRECPDNGSPSRIFCRLFKLQAIPLFPLELKA